MTRRRGGKRVTPARMLALAGELARTGVQGGEVGIAAARTITHRTAMMAAAAGDPVAMANPEFVRMGTEKLEAAVEAGQAMAKGMAELGQAWTALAAGPLLPGSPAFGRVPTPADWLAWQSRAAGAMASGMMMGGMAAGLRLAEAWSAVASAGLAPVHRTVSANARRLGRERG
ncbi:phasin family protein [Azospirillum sp. SYSU D00513]|uniref:phasin family protein n=1 Tax=Azospirillum sp. SYSU D00513 TaxID=2812561 RepID=UPI001A95C861|nr:phasin family protein [Azospirillum sp. SYSU D00513]